MSYFSNVGIKDGANLDAFSRVRVSLNKSLLDSQFTYDLQPLLFEQIVAESGSSIAHDTTNRMARMTFSSTPTGGKAYMQSFEHFRYTAGKSRLVFITFNMNSGVADVLKFAGYSDGTEGIEFQLNGTTKQFVVYSTTSNGNQTVTQGNWNIDNLDGTGPSGITLDVSKTHILVIDLQALYVGRVRIGFDIDGMIIYAHEFTHANLIATPYIKTANLPVRCGMTCTGTVSTTMNFICGTVVTEEGIGSSEGFEFSQNSGEVTAASGARTHALSIQSKLTFNSITNRVKFIFDSLNVVVTGSSPVLWELCLGDIITGTTTFNDVNGTYSAFQFNTAGTTSGSPAIVVARGYVSASNQVKGEASRDLDLRYPICLDAAGAVRNMGRLTVLVTGIGGASVCRVSMNWFEVR